MATLYAKAAGGNYSAAGTWSNVNSAGVDNSGPPTSADTVIFELGSGNVTIDAAASALTVSMTAGTGNYAGTLTHNAFVLTIAGSCTFTAGATYTPLATATITFSANATLTTAGLLMPLMIVNTGITLTLGDNLSFMASKVITLTLNGNSLDINGKTVSGNSATNRILIRSNTLGTARTITNTTGTFANADFKDITLSSAADLSAITGNSGDCGGNTNITFTSATTQHWISASGGNWSDVTKWTSRVPLPQDNAYFDNAFTPTAENLACDMPRLCKDIDFTGATGTPKLNISSIQNTIYGSVTFISDMTLQAGQTPNFETRSSSTMTCAGKSWGNVNFVMIGGTMVFLDAYLSIADITLTNGTLDFSTNNVNFTARSLISNNSNTRTISMGNGTWTLTASTAITVWNLATTTGLTLNVGSSTIAITDTGANAKTFAGGGKTYNTLAITGGGAGAIIITGANTFNRITVIGGTKSITLPGSTTTTILNGDSLGNLTNLITFTASAGSATLAKSSGIVSWNYISLTNIPASGSATFYAGVNSTDGGGNTNWIFTNAPVMSENKSRMGLLIGL